MNPVINTSPLKFEYRHDKIRLYVEEGKRGAYKKLGKFDNSALNELANRIMAVHKDANSALQFLRAEHNKAKKTKYKIMLTTLIYAVEDKSAELEKQKKTAHQKKEVTYEEKSAQYIGRMRSRLERDKLPIGFEYLISTAFYQIDNLSYRDNSKSIKKRIQTQLNELEALMAKGCTTALPKSKLVKHLFNLKCEISNPLELCDVLDNILAGLQSSLVSLESMKTDRDCLFSQLPQELFKDIAKYQELQHDPYSSVTKEEFIAQVSEPFEKASQFNLITKEYPDAGCFVRETKEGQYLREYYAEHAKEQFSNYMLRLKSNAVVNIPKNLQELIEKSFRAIFQHEKPPQTTIELLADLQEILPRLSSLGEQRIANACTFSLSKNASNYDIYLTLKNVVGTMRFDLLSEDKDALFSKVPKDLLTITNVYHQAIRNR